MVLHSRYEIELHPQLKKSLRFLYQLPTSSILAYHKLFTLHSRNIELIGLRHCHSIHNIFVPLFTISSITFLHTTLLNLNLHCWRLRISHCTPYLQSSAYPHFYIHPRLKQSLRNLNDRTTSMIPPFILTPIKKRIALPFNLATLLVFIFTFIVLLLHARLHS